MFFKGKATFCPTMYWMVCGEVELRGDSSQPSSSEDVSSILFSNSDRQQQVDSSSFNITSKASSHEGNISIGSSSSENLRRKGDHHNSLVKSIKDRLVGLDRSRKASSSIRSSSSSEKDYQQQQMARMGYLVENSERQRGVLIVCNLFEESLSNGCTELEVSWVTKRCQIEPGEILYAPKVKAYKQDMVDEDSIQFFIVARYVKLVSQKSAIYQFFGSNSKKMLLEPSEFIQQEKNQKKRLFTDASTQISCDKENEVPTRIEEPFQPLSKKTKRLNSTPATTISKTASAPSASSNTKNSPKDSVASTSFSSNTKNKKEQCRQRIKAIKKKIMKKVEETQSKMDSSILPMSTTIVKTEQLEQRADSVIFDSGTPSFFNNGFISDIVVISDDEEEESHVKAHESLPTMQSITPLICSETPIIPSSRTIRVKRDLISEEDKEINLSSNSPITLSMLYSTANQVKEMCSILDKSPLLEISQKEETEAILTNENALFTQEQLAPQVDETSSSSRSGVSSSHNLELQKEDLKPLANRRTDFEKQGEPSNEGSNNTLEKDGVSSPNLNNSIVKEEENATSQ